MKIEHDYKLIFSYIFAAICLTAVIVFNDAQSDSNVVAAIKSLEVEVRGLDKDFCETINEMHELRGFKVLDCKRGRIRLTPIEAQTGAQ